MLAKLARAVPEGDYLYEPKWDGFRALAFRDPQDVDIRSRNQKPFARYFPELVDAFRALPCDDFVLDGEIVVAGKGPFDFEALMLRLHPAASRVDQLRHETPATYIAFDALVIGDRDLRDTPFVQRREMLEALLAGAPPALRVTPATDDITVARDWLDQTAGKGFDGVVAKHRDLHYDPGRRAMVKVKTERTVDCVVAGFRLQTNRPLLGSLLLGLFDGDALRHVGVTSSFTVARRNELLELFTPKVTRITGHPWERGFGLERSPLGRLGGSAGRWAPDMALDWIPVAPDIVCEVAYDRADDCRFRHPARFVRLRPDRDPRSCTIDQLC